MADITEGSAAELGRRIAAGALDPVELTDAFLEKAGEHAFRDDIFARMTPDRARAEAHAARARASEGRRLSPLDGVPISWKDLFDTAGVATEAGTAMMAGRVPETDAEVLARATAAGTVCLGKTHMTEIAFSGLGLNPVTATSPNRHDPSLAPGGSSSGSAASVAYGLAPLSIGSDTGGSVRLPSAWNDLVGFKPTHNALPLDGVVPLVPSFDTVGPLAQTVEDAALAFAVMGGAAVPLDGADMRGARLLICETVAMADVEDAPGSAFENAVSRLSAAGAQVERAELPFLARAFEITAPLYTSEAWAEWREHVERDGDKMFYQVRNRVAAGATFKAYEFIEAWTGLRALRQSWAEAVAGYDAVLMPSVPILPPPVSKLLEDDDFYVTRNLMALRNTRIGNLMGLCGISLPTGIASCGIMMCGLPGSDARLLRLAQAVERALG